MKKPLFLFLTLAVSTLPLSAQISGIGAKAFPRQVLSSQLPAANGLQGMRIVTDALSSSSCTIGGGSVKLICFDNGTWTVVGLGLEGSQGPQGEPGTPGAQGPAGAAATIAIGTVTTGAAGSSASVTNTGSSSAAIFDFSIPRGDTGAQGIQGEIGATGPAGPVAGSDTQVIFNDAGVAAGDSGITYNKTTDALSISGLISFGGLTSSFSAIKPSTDRNGSLALRATRGDNAGATSLIGGSLQLGTASATSTTDHTLMVDSDRSEFTFGSLWLLGWANVSSNILANADVSITRSAAKRLSINAGRTPDGLGEIVSGKSIATAQILIVADNGNGGTRATDTLTPLTSYVLASCNDANGCDISLSETGAANGQVLRIICTSANVCGFIDSTGVSELAGNFDLGQFDSLSLLYVSDRWIELSRSNN